MLVNETGVFSPALRALIFTSLSCCLNIIESFDSCDFKINGKISKIQSIRFFIFEDFFNLLNIDKIHGVETCNYIMFTHFPILNYQIRFNGFNLSLMAPRYKTPQK